MGSVTEGGYWDPYRSVDPANNYGRGSIHGDASVWGAQGRPDEGAAAGSRGPRENDGPAPGGFGGNGPLDGSGGRDYGNSRSQGSQAQGGGKQDKLKQILQIILMILQLLLGGDKKAGGQNGGGCGEAPGGGGQGASSSGGGYNDGMSGAGGRIKGVPGVVYGCRIKMPIYNAASGRLVAAPNGWRGPTQLEKASPAQMKMSASA